MMSVAALLICVAVKQHYDWTLHDLNVLQVQGWCQAGVSRPSGAYEAARSIHSVGGLQPRDYVLTATSRDHQGQLLSVRCIDC